MNTEELLTEILTELRIMRGLLQQQPTDIAPNFQRSINEYPTFDWGTIDAKVIAHDRNGATTVIWHGQEYTRRRHVDYNNAVWFSRYTGKMEGEKKIYARLITFSDTKRPAKSLPDEITELLPEPKPANPPHLVTPPQTHRLNKPLEVAYWTLVKQFKDILTPDTLKALAIVANNEGYDVAYTRLQDIIKSLSTPQTTGDASAPVLRESATNPLDDLLAGDEVGAFFPETA